MNLGGRPIKIDKKWGWGNLFNTVSFEIGQASLLNKIIDQRVDTVMDDRAMSAIGDDEVKAVRQGGRQFGRVYGWGHRVTLSGKEEGGGLHRRCIPPVRVDFLARPEGTQLYKILRYKAKKIGTGRPQLSRFFQFDQRRVLCACHRVEQGDVDFVPTTKGD